MFIITSFHLFKYITRQTNNIFSSDPLLQEFVEHILSDKMSRNYVWTSKFIDRSKLTL